MRDITLKECSYVLGILLDLEDSESDRVLTRDIFETFKDEEKMRVFEYMRKES